jgi:hypothetical protein
MGLFEEVGRRVERFKQRASEAAAEEADYACGACGERLFADADTCPECGAAAVESLDDEGEDASDPDRTADADAAPDGDAAEDTAASSDPE